MIEPSSAPAPITASVEQLFSEIRQIYSQYKREVPKKRRPWPTSIQSRVLELWKLGVSTHQISVATTLPCQTMYSWRQRLLRSNPGFVPVRIIQRRRRKSLVESESHRGTTKLAPRSSSYSHSESTTLFTLTIVMPNGVRLEGVPLDQAARIARECALS